MKSNNPCITATVAEALERLPGPEGQRFATVFQHGSLLVEIYAPRGVDPQQPHTRDEIYFVAAGTGRICLRRSAGRRLGQRTFSLRRQEACTGLKTSPAI